MGSPEHRWEKQTAMSGNGCFYQRCERFSLDFEMFKVDGGPSVLTKDLDGVIFGDGQGEA
ncbi:hypothetical protein CK203_002595 [Vitis vinifera]|uniref:Uncharacterized protein n=1 Tax=Vitis vinifera TaxID=29760 RepID=A0A438KI19_VITVI|nr:hypothetical protein CK203_002595 [Vitis vinifera]